jgi:integrase
MPSVEWHGRSWRVRYTGPDGRRVTEPGFRTEHAAREHGVRQELAIRDGAWIDPRKALTSFGDYVDRWIAGQDLEAATMAKNESLARNQIKPSFGQWPIGAIDTPAVRQWLKGLREAGYSEWTVRSARGLLFTICEDAVVEDKLIPVNPVRMPRRRGRVANRAAKPAESLWATPAQVARISSRLAELTSRDDERALALLAAYTGMRWAELVGLEVDYCLPLGRDLVRVEWELVEVRGRFHRKPPKGGEAGRRDILLSPSLAVLIREQVKRARRCEAEGCGCGGRVYVFLGPDGGHLRRSNFGRRLWRPAVDGYTEQDRQRPRARKRGPAPKPRPDWGPIVRGLTPHDLRHSHKTWMIDDGAPEVAQAERLGHTIPGIRGVYSHVSDEMRERLVNALETRWQQSISQEVRYLRAVR